MDTNLYIKKSPGDEGLDVAQRVGEVELALHAPAVVEHDLRCAVVVRGWGMEEARAGQPHGISTLNRTQRRRSPSRPPMTDHTSHTPPAPSLSHLQRGAGLRLVHVRQLPARVPARHHRVRRGLLRPVGLLGWCGLGVYAMHREFRLGWGCWGCVGC